MVMMLSTRQGAGVEIDALFGISRAPLLLSTSLLRLGGQSLEALHPGLSLPGCFGIGPVCLGLNLHVEDLVFGSSDPPVVLPVNENEKLLAVGPIFIPGLLIGPFLL